MNLPSQTFMQENPGKRLPNDYTRFPGKMDHTTLIVLKVGEYELPGDLTSFLNIPALQPNPNSTTITSSASRESLLLSKRHSFYSKIPDNYISRPVASPLSTLPPPKPNNRPDNLQSSPIPTPTSSATPTFPTVQNTLASTQKPTQAIPQPQPQTLPPVKPSIIQPNLRPSHLPLTSQPAFKQITVPLLPLNECQPILHLDEPNQPRTAESVLQPPANQATASNSAPVTSNNQQQSSLSVKENPSSKRGSYVQIYTQDAPLENRIKKPGSFLELEQLQPTNSLHSGNNRYIRSYLDALATSNSNLFELASPTSPPSEPSSLSPSSAPSSVPEGHHKKTESISELYALDYLQDSPNTQSTPPSLSSVPSSNETDPPASTPQSSVTVPHPLESKEQSIDLLLHEMEIEEEDGKYFSLPPSLLSFPFPSLYLSYLILPSPYFVHSASVLSLSPRLFLSFLC